MAKALTAVAFTVTLLAAAYIGPLKPDPLTQPAFFDAETCQLQVADAGQALERDTHGITRAVLIGDSWATGAGIYPDRLARQLGLDLHVAAVGGTGYLNPGACGGREFLSRAWEVPQDAELVILAGGVNDVHQDPDVLAAAVRSVIAAVHGRAPGARIVVLGVPRVLLLSDEATGAVDDVLEQVAGAAFVDVRGWDISTLPDRIHPDPAGAREYADRIASAIDASSAVVPAQP